MRHLLYAIFITIGLGLSPLKASTPIVNDPIRKYHIYFSSEEGENLQHCYGSFLSFTKKAEDAFLTYICHITPEKHIEGRVLSYKDTPQGNEYLLEHFFGQSNAVMQILSMPNADNIKIAMTYYALESEDSVGVCWQYLLIDENLPGKP